MALWHSQSSSYSGLGKFRSTRRAGLLTEKRKQSGSYTFELLTMQPTAGSRSPGRFHINIFDSRNVRVAHLRDFHSAAKAYEGAERWVAEHAK